VKGWESARSDQKVSQTGNTTSHHCCGAAKDARLASGSKTCRHVPLLPPRAHLHLTVIILGPNMSAPQRRLLLGVTSTPTRCNVPRSMHLDSLKARQATHLDFPGACRPSLLPFELLSHTGHGRMRSQCSHRPILVLSFSSPLFLFFLLDLRIINKAVSRGVLKGSQLGTLEYLSKYKY
jgi:hypothetical protein